METDSRLKTRLLLLAAALASCGIFLVSRIPQDVGYHNFADARTVAGIPNAWNVLSNLPFVIAGIAGLCSLRRKSIAASTLSLRPLYLVFFAGIIATGLGSGWYHLHPDNASLFWDRLGMTIAFMGLFSIVIGERVCPRSARRLLLPLLLAGAGSVYYWRMTELVGDGDLRPYALVQFLPMLLIPSLLLLYLPRRAGANSFWAIILVYTLSKICEYFDQGIYWFTGFVSGHSLKHVVAAIVPLILLVHIRAQKTAETKAGSPLPS